MARDHYSSFSTSIGFQSQGIQAKVVTVLTLPSFSNTYFRERCRAQFLLFARVFFNDFSLCSFSLAAFPIPWLLAPPSHASTSFLSLFLLFYFLANRRRSNVKRTFSPTGTDTQTQTQTQPYRFSCNTCFIAFMLSLLL